MKKIGILSDTHGYWDDRFATYFADCDEIWHAGDVGDYDIILRLREICMVRAVCGNIDTGSVRRNCPELLTFDIEGVRVLMTHIGGYPGRWSPRHETTATRRKRPTYGRRSFAHTKGNVRQGTRTASYQSRSCRSTGMAQSKDLVLLTIDGSDMRDCDPFAY